MKETSTLKYILIFFLIVFVAAAISLSIKAVSLISSSTFKHDTFNILFLDHTGYLVNVNLQKKNITILEIENARPYLANKSRIAQSLILNMPLDASVTTYNDNSLDEVYKKFFPLGQVYNVATHGRFKKDNLNSYDLFKLSLRSSSIGAQNINRESIENFSTKNPIDQSLLNQIGSDSQIYNEKISVEVFNGTDIDGLGSKVASMLRTIGYNVIQIDEIDSKTSYIKTNSTNSPSVDRLGKIMDLPVSEFTSDDHVADVELVLGSDFRKKIGK